MKYKFGDSVITSDGFVGIVIEIQTLTLQYFVKNIKCGKLYYENEIKEWHGAW